MIDYEFVSIFRFLGLLLLSWVIVISCAPQALGQFSELGGNGISATLPPAGVNRYGNLEVTWVRSQLGNGKLFQIASPTVVNRRDVQAGDVPVELRAKNIEDLLQLEIGRFRQHAIAQILGSQDEQLRSVQVIVSTLKNLPVLQISDQATSRPLTIATVTAPDADFYGRKPDAIAQQWKVSLEREMTRAQDLYSPDTFPRRLKRTALIPFGLIIWSGVLGGCRVLLGKKRRDLQIQYEKEVQSSSNRPSVAESESVVAGLEQKELVPDPLGLGQILQQQFSLANQIDVYRLLQWLILWTIILSWYLGTYWITIRLPLLMPYSNKVLTQPLYFLIIWFLVSLMIRVSHFVIRRSVDAWKENPHLIFGEVDARRKVLRSQTISGALRGFATFTLIFVGVLLTLTQFGLPVSSILTGSALLGLALSFGAQSLIKDVVNGCLILLEDQFGVGDVITANNETGIVERLNLRLTQLRSIDGELISIPNSNITLVKNKTSSWSRVNLAIEVAYSTDLDQAIAVIERVATQMSQEADWQALILEPPQVLGVDGFGENSITIRLWIQTEPGQQFLISRELRRRLKLAFDQAGISIPFPQRSLWLENSVRTELAHRSDFPVSDEGGPASHQSADEF